MEGQRRQSTEPGTGRGGHSAAGGTVGRNNPLPSGNRPASWGVRVPCGLPRMEQGRGLISKIFLSRLRRNPVTPAIYVRFGRLLFSDNAFTLKNQPDFFKSCGNIAFRKANLTEALDV